MRALLTLSNVRATLFRQNTLKNLKRNSRKKTLKKLLKDGCDHGRKGFVMTQNQGKKQHID